MRPPKPDWPTSPDDCASISTGRHLQRSVYRMRPPKPIQLFDKLGRAWSRYGKTCLLGRRTMAHSPSNPDRAAAKRGYSTREAARYIGRSVSWLRKKRLRGPEDPGDRGPRWFAEGRTGVIYLREDLDTWLDHLAESRALERRAAPAVLSSRVSRPQPADRPAAGAHTAGS